MVKEAKDTKEELIKQILESNIALQNKHADLMLEFLKLSKQMKALLDLFEGAATAIKKGEDKDPLSDRLDKLLEQNQRIANGLLLLEKFVREKQKEPSLGFPR